MSTQRGREAEQAAADYLQSRGYEILARNYRTREGEIDIIAKLERILVFVEVKYRAGVRCGLPREAVTVQKQRKIARAALAYLCEPGMADLTARFDVVEVTPGEIVLIEDAFWVG